MKLVFPVREILSTFRAGMGAGGGDRQACRIELARSKGEKH